MINLNNSYKEVSFQAVKETINQIFINHEMDANNIDSNAVLDSLDAVKEKLDDKILFFIKRENKSVFIKGNLVTQHNFSSTISPCWTTTIRIKGASCKGTQEMPKTVITLNGSILYNILQKEIHLVDKVDSNPVPILKKRS